MRRASSDCTGNYSRVYITHDVQWFFLNGIELVSFLNTIFAYFICGILIIGYEEVVDLLRKIHDQNEPKEEMLIILSSLGLLMIYMSTVGVGGIGV